MKALTIYQPWASLIMAGAKPYEFRGWRPPAKIVGQRIVIHSAAKKMDMDEVNYLHMLMTSPNAPDIRDEAAQTCLIPWLAHRILYRAIDAIYSKGQVGGLPYGAGLGTAIVGEPRLGTDIAAEFGVARANDSDRDQHAQWGWPMLDIEIWPAPIPMRGMQGLWNWPTPADLTGGAA